MPKTIARIPIGMDPETKAVLHRLADLMDTSVSKLAGSFLDDARPQLEKLADALERASADPHTSMTTLHLAIIEAQRHALQAQTDFLQDGLKKKSDT
mgnify:CR=1 FL=1